MNAIHAGAKAVVIINSQDTHFKAESGDGSTTQPSVNIPVVMISKVEGDRVVGRRNFTNYILDLNKAELKKLDQRNRIVDTSRRVRTLLGTSCFKTKDVSLEIKCAFVNDQRNNRAIALRAIWSRSSRCHFLTQGVGSLVTPKN